MTERWHGTLGGYNNHHCRCEECAMARRLWYRRKNGHLPLDEYLAKKCRPHAVHGTLTRYRKWGCRCALCRRKVADDRKRFRDNAKARVS